MSQEKITTKQILAFHWKQAMRYPKLVALTFIVAPTSVILERYITPLIIAALLLGIQNGTVTLASSWWMIVVYGVLQLLTQVVGSRVTLWAVWAVQVEGSRAIYRETYEKLTRQSLNFYNNNFAGSLVARVNKIAAAFIEFWNSTVYEVLFIVTSVVATVVGTALLFWQYAVILVIFIIIFSITAYYGTRFMRSRREERAKAYTKISARLSDSISNMFAVKIDSRELYEQRRFNETVDTMVEKEYYVRSGLIGTSTVYSFIIALIRISVLVFSIWAVQTGAANAAVVYLLLTYTFNLIGEIWNITNVFRSLYQVTGDSEEMLETLAEPISIVDTSSDQLRIKHGEIVVNNVSFHHDDDPTLLFKQLNLVIPAGQKVGIVGMSGSGKTTLTKLLLRFLDPTSGEITIDGTDISSVTQASLHRVVAYVPQEPLLFHRSISENIGYSRPDASQKEIIVAAKKAHADEFVENLPKGYETLVGERGVKLSGGQRQRVAIARAILKNAPILILDEATSALDSESEQLIQKALAQLMKGKTSIVIAHRLSTIAKLDRIIVLEDGHIVEDGTHADLLKQNGRYAKLWGRQSGGFIEE
jgi:ATP-binding cassette subfamily B protein